MTLIWLLILAISGAHWQELHPWTTTFTLLFIAGLIDFGVVLID